MQRRDILKAAAAASTALAALPGTAPEPAQAAPPSVPQPPDKPTTSPVLRATGKVTAKVDLRLLTKSNRFFSGTVNDRICETLQNARRAGATKFDVQVEELPNDKYRITLTDNGHGLTDFGQLLALGFSGWADNTEAAEDPAGMGFFSLAPRTVLAQSRGQQILIEPSGWLGMPVTVTTSEYQGTGLRLVFEDDDDWSIGSLEAQGRYSGLRLTRNGEELRSDSFIDANLPSWHYPELGVRIQLLAAADVAERLTGVGYIGWRTTSTCVNFHGNRVRFYTDTIADRVDGHWFVEFTGEPTPLRLKLPDRDKMYEDEGFEQLCATLEKLAYEWYVNKRSHDLSYKDWARGKALGFDLPEATPSWNTTVGSWEGDWCVEDDDVRLPGIQLLHVDEQEDVDTLVTLDILTACNVALGFPYAAVAPRSEHVNYSWVQSIPQLIASRVEVANEDEAQACDGFDGSRQLLIVDQIDVVLTIQHPDGHIETVVTHPPVAVAELEDNCGPVYATRAGVCDPGNRSILQDLLSGYHSEAEDSYSTYLERFEEELEWVLASIQGPHEPHRREVVKHVNQLLATLPGDTDGAAVTVYADGRIVVQSPTLASYNVLPAEA